MKILLVTFLLLVTGAVFAENKVGPFDLDKLYQAPKWEKTELAKKPGMTGILYSGLPYLGKPVQVFAYYNVPQGTAPEGGWPAVVCVHGGGGTAFDRWVKLWNQHGYAAISMDLEGHLPLKADTGKGRKPTPNPGPARRGQFHNYDKPLDQQWYYHAMAQVILADSLLRSFPEINKDKIGVTGFSWGGTLTASVMGVDTRFKMAVPVYGCGFLVGSDGWQGRALKPGKHADNQSKNYDGSLYFKNVNYPTLWVNGTNDFHFAMPPFQKSAQAVKGPATMRFKLKMPHGHLFHINEIFAFADSVFKGGKPLLKLSKPTAKGNVGIIECTTPADIKSAKLLYTMDEASTWPNKEWQMTDAKVEGSQIIGPLPPGTYAFYFEVTDKRDLMVSSEYLVHEVPGGEKKVVKDAGKKVDFDALYKKASTSSEGTKIIIADNFEGNEITKNISSILQVEDPKGKAGILLWYDQVASGGKSMKINNSDSVKHAYQPVLGQWFRGENTIKKGELEISFDVFIPSKGGNNFTIQARDYTVKPVHNFLTFFATYQGVHLNGKNIGVPQNQWVHYALSIPVGVDNGKIKLTIIDSKFGTRTIERPITGGRAGAVSWIGLMAGGKADAHLFVDNLVLKVVE